MRKIIEGQGKMIRCNYCEEVVDEEKMRSGEARGWTYGTQGVVIPTGPVCFVGTPTDGVKHACPKALCQAKLLVWSRS